MVFDSKLSDTTMTSFSVLNQEIEPNSLVICMSVCWRYQYTVLPLSEYLQGIPHHT